MANRTVEKVVPPSSKTIVRGIQGFILFSAIGIALAIWWKAPANIVITLRHLKSPFLVLLIPLIGLDYILGGIRHRLFFNGRILPKISLWDCMRSNWANMFMGVVTPFQTGGGPAQIFMLWRCGAKVSQAVLVPLINLAATLILILVACMVTMLLLPADLFGNNLTHIIRGGLLIVSGITGLVLLVMLFPDIGLILVRLAFRLIPVHLFKMESFRDRLMTILGTEVRQFRRDFRAILRRSKILLVLATLFTMALFLNKFLIGYVIVLSLGQHVNFGNFVGLQIILYFLIYFAPTPGASGLAEISSAWLMERIISPDILVFFVIALRLFTTIAGALIGGFVLIAELRNWTKDPTLSVKVNDKPRLEEASDSLAQNE